MSEMIKRYEARTIHGGTDYNLVAEEDGALCRSCDVEELEQRNDELEVAVKIRSKRIAKLEGVLAEALGSVTGQLYTHPGGYYGRCNDIAVILRKVDNQ